MALLALGGARVVGAARLMLASPVPFPFALSSTKHEAVPKTRPAFDKACLHFIYAAAGKAPSNKPHLSEDLAGKCQWGTQAQCQGWVESLLFAMKMDERDHTVARADVASVIENEGYVNWCETIYNDVSMGHKPTQASEAVPPVQVKAPAVAHAQQKDAPVKHETQTKRHVISKFTKEAVKEHAAGKKVQMPAESTTTTQHKKTEATTTTTAATTTTVATTTTTKAATTTTTSTTTTKASTTTKAQLATTVAAATPKAKAAAASTSATKAATTTTKPTIAKVQPATTTAKAKAASTTATTTTKPATPSTTTSSKKCACVHRNGKEVCHCVEKPQ